MKIVSFKKKVKKNGDVLVHLKQLYFLYVSLSKWLLELHTVDYDQTGLDH